MVLFSPTGMTLATWLHTLDPYAIKLWDGGPIRWYGLAYLAGFAAGYALSRQVVRGGATLLPAARLMDFVMAVAIGIVVGGRLGYACFYDHTLLWPVWRLLLLNQGGMASHGGMIGMIVASAWYAWRLSRNTNHVSDPKNHTPSLSWATHGLFLMDLVAFVAPVGVFFGRVANFINGELIGRVASTNLPWAVKFPQELYDMDPAQLPRALAQYPSVGVIVEQIQAHDPTTIALVEPLLLPRHPSTLYAALSEGVAVFLVLLWIYRKPRKPGVVVAWGMLIYALARIGNEFFREPDAHLGYQAWHLTRGQWLTAVVLIAGLGLLIWASRRTAPLLGGWRTRTITNR